MVCFAALNAQPGKDFAMSLLAMSQGKWDRTEEKPAVIAITTAAFVGVWALSGLVDRIDKLPVIGGLLELVGLVVTSWFVYRYLIFGPDR